MFNEFWGTCPRTYKQHLVTNTWWVLSTAIKTTEVGHGWAQPAELGHGLAVPQSSQGQFAGVRRWDGEESLPPACRGDEGCGGVDEALPCVSGESRCRGALCRGTAEVARHREEEEKYFFFFFFLNYLGLI